MSCCQGQPDRVEPLRRLDCFVVREEQERPQKIAGLEEEMGEMGWGRKHNNEEKIGQIQKL